MATAEIEIPSLEPGDNLTRAEFLRLWEGHPDIKKAELIGGVVYMPSPISVRHSDADNNLGGWACYYKAATPGVESGQNATLLLSEDTAQPDVNLRIKTEYGGKSWQEGNYLAGSPEWLGEVCLSSASYDLHQKLEAYEAAGIQEYLALLLHEKDIRWHFLKDGKYQTLTPGPDGVWRSRVFPGLWLDRKAFFDGDMRRVLARLQEGLDSAEHKAFVEELASKSSRS